MISVPNPRILTATAFSALLLASCAVGPKAPDATLPPLASGAFVGSTSASVSAATLARDDWWRLYNDPVLDGLVTQALTENNELEAAAANLRRVRAALGEARTGRLSTTTTSATRFSTPVWANSERSARSRLSGRRSVGTMTATSPITRRPRRGRPGRAAARRRARRRAASRPRRLAASEVAGDPVRAGA